MAETKPANVQKRDTTFKQEHGAVAHLLKRKPHQALDRAIWGAQKLLAEGQGKQALNVLTLVKPVLAQQTPSQQASYYRALGDLHTATGSQQAAERAYARAAELTPAP